MISGDGAGAGVATTLLVSEAVFLSSPELQEMNSTRIAENSSLVNVCTNFMLFILKMKKAV